MKPLKNTNLEMIFCISEIKSRALFLEIISPTDIALSNSLGKKKTIRHKRESGTGP